MAAATLRLAAVAAAMTPLVGGLPTGASAQSVTNAFQGFSSRSEQPVKVEADRLEVREKEQAATFSGKVQVTQGGSRLNAQTLVVFYSSTEESGGATDSGGRQIRRFEAAGGVQVLSKDQKATGDRGVFDMPTNTVVLTGNVIVAQGTNVIRGDRLIVDLTRQTSRLETSRPSGRVEGIFTPGSVKSDKTPARKP